ncbi:hypothetical protein QZH41_005684 [Actinostola sp. cb2023]|nr:hypothetical protein QZH41_005684 [Actinostola sp. cb2023]
MCGKEDVFVSVSGITHSTIAWERYRATVTPFKPRISKTKAKCLLPAIWMFSYIACGLPLAITTMLRSAKGGKVLCTPHWSVLHRRIFEVFLVAVFIVLQLVLQTYAYSNIIRTLRSKNGLFKDSAQNPEDRMSSANSAREKRKSKTIKILLVLVVLFQIGYIPRGIVMLISEFSKDLPPEYRYVELLSLILYYLKHVLNPFILFIMSTEFKIALKNTLRCKKQYTSKCSAQVALQTSHAQVGSSGWKSDEEEDTIQHTDHNGIPQLVCPTAAV